MYSILRTVKIKDRQKISKVSEHNFRLRSQLNIDDDRTKENVILVNKLKVDIKVTPSLQEKLTEHYQKLGIKERADNVLMMEFVVSASPEFFEEKTDGEIKKWADHQVKYFEKEFGQNLQMGILHLDEKTPHIHFMVSTEHETVKTYKNRHGTTEKKTWSLNAKRFNPQFLTDMQSSYAMHNSIFGLKRGRKSTKEHVKLKDYYDSIKKMDKELKSKETEHKKLLKLKEYYPKLKENIINLIDVVDSCLGILESKELTSQEREYIDYISKSIPSKKQPKVKKTI
jgi:hypothetical protein